MKMSMAANRPGPWVAKRMMMAIVVVIILLVAALALGGCGGSAPLVVDFATGKVSGSTGAVNFDGVVVGNNTPYSLNVLKYGPYGLEAVLSNFPPGASFTLFNDYLPPNQTVMIVTNAFWKGTLVGQATRSFYFSSYGGYSRLERCVFNTSDFRMSPPLGFQGSAAVSSSRGTLTREAASLLKLGK